MTPYLLAVIAVIAGLVGAVMGSTHPIASALVSAFAGAIVSSVVMAFCVVSLPHHEFGEKEIVVAICGGAVIFAVLTLSCTKMVTIVTSSIVGATMIILAVDFFMHDLATLKWVRKWAPLIRFISCDKLLSLADDQNPPESITATVLGWHHRLHVARRNDCRSARPELHHGLARGPQEATLPSPAVAGGQDWRRWCAQKFGTPSKFECFPWSTDGSQCCESGSHGR